MLPPMNVIFVTLGLWRRHGDGSIFSAWCVL